MPSLMDLIRMQYENPIVRAQMGFDPSRVSMQRPQSVSSARFLPQSPRGGPVELIGAMQEVTPTSDTISEDVFEPTTGSKMEADSRRSIDDILSSLMDSREKDRAHDRQLAWMSFFSNLASSKNPSLLGGLGEASGALTKTMQEQAPKAREQDTALANAQIKYEQWLQEQQLNQEENLSQADLRDAQAAYYRSAGKLGGQAPSDVREWQYFNTLSDDDKIRYMALKRRQAEEAGGIKLSETIGKGAGEGLIKKRETAEDANLTLYANSEARNLLDSGIITGKGADFFREFGKGLQQAGINVAEDPIANTEAYVALRAQEVGRMIKAFGAGTGLSDADREYAEKAAAGKISLTEESLRKILEISDKQARHSIKVYRSELEKVPESAKPYDIDVKEVEASNEPKTKKSITPEEARAELLRRRGAQ